MSTDPVRLPCLVPCEGPNGATWRQIESYVLIDPAAARRIVALGVGGVMSRDDGEPLAQAPAGTDVSALAAEYLAHGGLFNPELMDHEKVRDLIIKQQDELASLQQRLEKAEGENADRIRRIRALQGASGMDHFNDMPGDGEPSAGEFALLERIDEANERLSRVRKLASEDAMKLQAERDQARAELAKVTAERDALMAQFTALGHVPYLKRMDELAKRIEGLHADLTGERARAEKAGKRIEELGSYIRAAYAQEFEEDENSPAIDLVRHAFLSLAMRRGALKHLRKLLAEWRTWPHQNAIPEHLYDETDRILGGEASAS